MTEKTDIRDSDEKVVEIEMERLRTFTNHPFKVIGDSQMIELQDSIKKYGVLNPLIVRPRKEGYYEIISGHRRKYAAERLGYKKIPVIIRMMQDDEAVVTMVDSNLQREQITPSEKAYAYIFFSFSYRNPTLLSTNLKWGISFDEYSLISSSTTTYSFIEGCSFK